MEHGMLPPKLAKKSMYTLVVVVVVIVAFWGKAAAAAEAEDEGGKIYPTVGCMHGDREQDIRSSFLRL